MNQKETIQQNIDYLKKQLNRARKIVPLNDLQKLHIDHAIESYLEDIKNLKDLLKGIK